MDESEKHFERDIARQESNGVGTTDKPESVGLAMAPRLRKLHDSDVSFQEYHYYARLTREEQKTWAKPVAGKNFLAYLIPNLQKAETGPAEVANQAMVNISDREKRKLISDDEWANASRALRTAGTGAIFYLITTDILGPFGLPYAFATTGWG